MILSYILHRLAPVEHRREFDHHALSLSQQFIDDFEHIGGAVGNAVGTPPMFIATGWIDEDQISRCHRVQILNPIAIHHLYLR